MMSRRWMGERRKEYYFREAKRSGYRSRAAYKLKQINDRYHIISKGNRVVDLGCAPGGWLQVACEIVDSDGKVVGVDIKTIEPLSGVEFIRGDITDPQTAEKILAVVPEVDVVISDMSPNITGHYSMDHARSIGLAESALVITERILSERGNFVVKVFQGDLFKQYLDKVKERFAYVRVHSPKASRKSSSEIYLIGKDFRK
jgi:23S rRNA (uridine2552-2'-O)-methyltransferase